MAQNSDSRKDATGGVVLSEVNHIGIDDARYISLSKDIGGDYIIESSIRGTVMGRANRTWISTVLEGRYEVSWSLAPVGNDIYNGNSGIALYLLMLGKTTKNQKYIDASIEAANSVIHELHNLKKNHPYLIGGFNGLAGYVLMLSHLYDEVGTDRIYEAIKVGLNHIEKLVSEDRIYDVISGSAGALLVTCSLIKRWGGNREIIWQLRDIGNALSRHLINNSKEMSTGCIAWGGDGEMYVPSSGFAHGNSGISAALSLYKSVTISSIEGIDECIEEALSFERSLYCEEHANWYPNEARDRISNGWCHGAPGILLSKSMLKLSGYNSNQLDVEIGFAYNSTFNEGFGFNTSLCHGDMGNLMILRMYESLNDSGNLMQVIRNAMDNLVVNKIEKDYKNGLFRGTKSMGMMVGLAGVGYSLLSAVMSEELPNILTLE